MIECDGLYEDGRTSRSQAGHLQQSANAVQITLDDDQPPIEVPLAALRVSDRLGTLPRRISLGEGRAFVTPDHAAADQLRLRSQGDGLTTKLHLVERRLSVVLVSLALFVGLLAGVLFWGTPAAARVLAQRIPQATVDAIGSHWLTTMDQLHFSPSTLPSDRQDELRSHLRSFDDYPATIAFRKGGKTIGANAFALPGRIVVLSDELIALAQDDNEILSVYLHEVGHLRGRHSEAMIIQGSIWLIILTFVTGDISGVADVLYVLPSTISQFAFSRRFEREADAFAVTALNSRGLSAEPLAALLKRLTIKTPEASGDSLLRYLSTHPATDARIFEIRAQDGSREQADSGP